MNYKPEYFSFSMQKKKEEEVHLRYELKKLKQLSRDFIKVDSGPTRPVVADAENPCEEVGFITL